MIHEAGAKLRVLFVNENIGGHSTVHNHLKAGFDDHPRVEASFLDVPRPGIVRRLAGMRIPGLAQLDLDLQSLRAQLALSFWVRRAIRRHHGTYDLLHVYTQNAALLLRRGRPMVISTDTTNAHNAYRIPQRTPTRFTRFTVALTKPFERRALSQSVAVVANSRWARVSLADDYEVEPAKLWTIPFGITDPGPSGASSRNDNAIPTIGFVGRQFTAKGGRVLLEAFERLDGPARLLIVSTEPMEETENVSVVDDLQPGDDRLWNLLSECSIFAFPSPIDQAPNAVLEAMAAGLPVVAVNTGAVGEMVADGETGFLIEAGDAGALRSALQELLDNPDLRRSMGAKARQRFEERYDMAVAIDSLTNVFYSVQDLHGQGGAA